MAGEHGGARPGAGKPRGTKHAATIAQKATLAELAKSYTDDALTVLVRVMNNDAQTGSARVSAAVAILDRGYGRPFQAIHHAGADGGELPSIDPMKLSAGALRELLDAVNETPDPEQSGPDSD